MNNKILPEDLHEMVKTHKCVICGDMIRELKHIGKSIGDCKECGSKVLSPLDVISQHKAWGDE